MGDGFIAEIAVLRGAGRKAHTLSEELRASAADLLSGDAVDAGHDGLGRQIQEFAAQCEDMAARFTGESSSIGDRLLASAKAYHRVDKDSALTFRGHVG